MSTEDINDGLPAEVIALARSLAAQGAFEKYNFGVGVICVGQGAWRDTDTDDWNCEVHVAYEDDEGSAPSTKLAFHVVFKSSAIVAYKSYAYLFGSGNQLGTSHLAKPVVIAEFEKVLNTAILSEFNRLAEALHKFKPGPTDTDTKWTIDVREFSGIARIFLPQRVVTLAELDAFIDHLSGLVKSSLVR